MPDISLTKVVAPFFLIKLFTKSQIFPSTHISVFD